MSMDEAVCFCENAIPKNIWKEFRNNSPQNPKRIPKEFLKNSKRIPKNSYLKNSKRIPKEFRNSELQKIRYEFQGNYNKILQEFLKKFLKQMASPNIFFVHTVLPCCLQYKSAVQK